MCRVNGAVRQKPAFKVGAGDALELTVPDAEETPVEKEDIPLEILYEDADLAVVVKPCGMVVHPAAGNESGTLVNALLYHMEDLSGIGGGCTGWTRIPAAFSWWPKTTWRIRA